MATGDPTIGQPRDSVKRARHAHPGSAPAPTHGDGGRRRRDSRPPARSGGLPVRPDGRSIGAMGRRAILFLDVAVKVALIALLLHAVANPDLAQYSGKAMLGRALAFPIAAFLVPAVWWLNYRGRPYPAAIDLLFTTPFLIDVAGNALDLYDSIPWWDDVNHFVNWMLVTAAVALVLRSTGLGRLNCFGLAVGFAAVTAIAWELAEYVTFIRFSSELATAYVDTLGDLVLGTLGGALGATIVGLTSRRASWSRSTRAS
jgi:hypothetical protein